MTVNVDSIESWYVCLFVYVSCLANKHSVGFYYEAGRVTMIEKKQVWVCVRERVYEWGWGSGSERARVCVCVRERVCLCVCGFTQTNQLLWVYCTAAVAPNDSITQPQHWESFIARSFLFIFIYYWYLLETYFEKERIQLAFIEHTVNSQ